jgi:hypothetical protein
MDNNGAASLAEVGSVQLEFKYLSEISGDGVYWQKAEKVMNVILESPSMEGIYPIFLSPETGQFFASEIRLGSRGDSFYEVRPPIFDCFWKGLITAFFFSLQYLIKQYLQTVSDLEFSLHILR